MANEAAGPIGIVKGDEVQAVNAAHTTAEVPPAPAQSKKTWTASLHLAHAKELHPDFVGQVRAVEEGLGLSIVLLVQQGRGDAQGITMPFELIDVELVAEMAPLVRSLRKDRPVGLLIESPGGYAREAFILARLLRKHCGGFTAIVANYAKSAATLLALGANRLIMHEDAELGPIDVQVVDHERERIASALDEVQSLERLHAQALNLIDSTMMMLVRRARKRTDVVLPHVLQYVSQTMRPLFEKIDTVHFTSMSRTLKLRKPTLSAC